MAGGGKGVKYAEAAHTAARTVETQGGLLECVVPANSIVREFLLEARRERMSRAVEHTDQLAGQMKRAADALVTHPFRVWDSASAQRVKGCGPAMARILTDNLWRLYPAEPPEDEELEEVARQEAALKAAAAAQRKRKKQEAAAAAAGGMDALAAGPAAAAGLPESLAAAADAAAEAAAGGKGRSKAAQEYIPQLGSAPYAFLLVMLQAQKGPAKQQHFGKQELIDLAEASGLSTKPINGDGDSKRQTADGRMFKFDGWSSFRTLIKKGLAHEWSNPKKVSLTAQGFALAERLYRKEVARGAVEPMPGIPTTGPLLFQLEEADPAAAAAAAAAVPAGALPSAALNPSRHLAPRDGAAAAAQRRADAAVLDPILPRAASGDVPPAPSVRPAALQPARGHEAAGPAVVPRAAAAGAAAARAAPPPSSAYYEYDEKEDEEDAELGISLRERLQRQRQPQPPHKAVQQAHTDLLAAAAAAGAAAAALVPAPPGLAPAAAGGAAATAGGGEDDVIDLLSDDSPSPIRKRGRRLAGATAAGQGGAATAAALAAVAPAPAAALAAFAAAAAPAAGGEAAGQLQAAVPDEHVAAMVEMGYSDRKARRALRRSLGELGLPDIERAVEVAELLESEGEDSDAEGRAGLVAQQAQQAHQMQQLEPRRGWEQPPAGGDMQARDLLLGPNPAFLAGGAAPSAAARQPSQVAAAALQRNDSERSQQSQQWGQQQQQQQQQQGVPAVAVRGHIRMGSQRQPLPDSQQQQEEAGDGEYSIDRFMSQLDKRLNGDGSGDAVAEAGEGLARSGSGSGSGSGRESGGQGGSLRQQPSDMRLPPLPPGRRFSEEYEVMVLVDGREHFQDQKGLNRIASLQQHLDKMKQAGLAVEGRHLPIGDVVWVARSRRAPGDEYVLDFIVERKSVQDLASSIMSKSGRYERQKYYLHRCGVRCVYYLVEGDPDQLPKEVEQKMCRTASARTEVWDGFKLLRTTDHISTFRLYQALTQRIQALYRDCTAPAAVNGAGQLPTFAAWQARCKENGEGTVTLHDIWGVMLQGVPKLGPEATRAILLRYPTPLDLYRAYQAVSAAAEAKGECGNRAAERLLRGLKTEGAKAGIGPDKAALVYNSLFKRRMAGGRAVA